MAHRNTIRWNCRDVQANFNELEIIAEEFNVGIFCLQETIIT